MALDPEELRKRRLQRAKHRENRRKHQRKLILQLTIAAVVLLAVVLGVYFAGKNQSPETPQTTVSQQIITEPQQTIPEPQPEEETTLPPTTVVHVAAAGDLNINEAVVNSGGETYDYTQTFLDVAPLLADADLAVLNFEGIVGGAPYGSTHSAPKNLAQALDRAGVDLIQLANSYSITMGTLGLSSTIDSIRAAGMEPLGVYANQADYEANKGYTICQVQGVKIAFVAFTKGMDGMTLPVGSENCVNVLYKDYNSTYQNINTAKINAVLDAAAEENPDITIALLHWGSEFNDTVSSSQESIRKLMQAKGVDAIIGTHSHYLQKIDYNPDTGMLVAYSLGDFLGDAQRSGSEYSVILDLEITKDNVNGGAKITGYSYTPIFTVAEPGKPLRVVRIQQAMEAHLAEYINPISKETYDAMVYATERIEQRIHSK